MAQVIYQIVDSYYKTFEKFPKLPIIWSRQTHRIVAIRNFKELLGWGIGCIFTMGLCVLIPKFAQFIYIVRKYLQLGHYPDGDRFATPIQVLSVAVALLACGGAISISFFALLFNREIVHTVNSLFDMEQVLVTRRNLVHHRAKDYRDKFTPKEALFAKVLGYVPLFALYLAPAIAIFAVVNGLDPLTFVVERYFRPDWRRYQLVRFLGFKTFSLIMLTAAVISASKILLAVACIFIFPAWFLQHNIRMLGKDYDAIGNEGVVWIRNVRIYIIMYNTIVIGFARLGPYLAVIALGMLVGCGLAITICNVVTVRMRTHLPISLYPIFPFIVVLLTTVLNTVLRFAAECTELSAVLIRFWMRDAEQRVGAVAGKIHRERLKAMKPIEIYVGLGRETRMNINKEFVCLYNQAIIDYTVKALLELTL
ncbi:hypothetical protein Fcan01_10609 [Folsomia candida]|uniref:Uncharacterized protein n=1 Tax=Folsomia candida TaxID=158441 RepID=A0A226E9Q3_FOLCA|nr:hypothetical protein Fcan01_10609 [Folsomia candida]